MSKQESSEEITSELTPEGIHKLSKGDILTFLQDGNKVDYKVTRKTKGRVWVRKVVLVNPGDLKVVDADE